MYVEDEEYPAHLRGGGSDGTKHGFFSRVSDWYARWERPISSVSLIGGFVFDALTLTRVDLFWENVWVLGHLVIVALCIFFINLTENMRARGKDPARIHFWLITILQFFFGGLLSTFLVYYFRSGTISVSWPFMLLLLLAFIANERLKHHYSRLIFQIALLSLCILAFAIFIVPVIVHSISVWVFILSEVVSIAAIGFFLWLLHLASKEHFRRSRLPLFAVLLVIFAGINFLYFYHLIPPLPLSLKDGDIYDSFTVNSPGNYTATENPAGFFGFLDVYKPVEIPTGTPLYAYTAVFSPASFKLSVVHEWQRYSTTTAQWATMGRITLGVTGGGDGGYRTFSEITPTLPGQWRVNVKTTSGAVIGRIDFALTFGSSTQPLQTVTIN
jgi:hypothetical protein